MKKIIMPLISFVVILSVVFSVLFGLLFGAIYIVGQNVPVETLSIFVSFPAVLITLYVWGNLLIRALLLNEIDEYLEEHPEYDESEEDTL